MIAAPSIRDLSFVEANAPDGEDPVRRDVRLEPSTCTADRQDHAAVSIFLPSPVATRSSERATLAAGRASSQLAAALAFFHSRPASRLAKIQTRRLRV